MSLEARGLAITLMCHRLTKGELPKETDALARLCGAFPEEMEKHWKDVAPVVMPAATSKGKAKIDPEEVAAVDTDAIADKPGDQLNAAETFSVVQEVIAAYVEHHPRAKPGVQDEKRVMARLKDGFSMDDLLIAIEGCHKSPYHCGDNEQNRVYQSFELIMRNPDKVNSFISLAQEGGRRVISTREKRTVTAAQSLLSEEFGDDAC